MVSLARTPAQAEEAMAPIAMSEPSKPSGPQYPYGCCISFDDETLGKLGLDGEMPAPGDVIEFTCSATVTSASKDASTGSCRVECQITDMEVNEQEDAATEAMEQSAARRGRFYGKSMGNYDRDIASYDGNREAGARP